MLYVILSDAARVCGPDLVHKLSEQTLQVEIYFPFMDRDPTATPTLPPPIVVEYLDSYQVR